MKILPRIVTLDKNHNGRDYIVGDLHGHVVKLQQQLSALNFNPEKDRLICVGDLIDRGPDSPATLALLNEPWFYAVLGNHEFLMVSGLKESNSKYRLLWLEHGGDWIANTSPNDWPSWFDAIERLPLAIEVTGQDNRRYGVIHADYPRFHWSELSALNDTELKQCIWGRENFKSRSQHTIAGIDYLIHGHNICEDELQLGNRYYIDTGAYLGNDLCIKPI